jgi:hypothetical protein
MHITILVCDNRCEVKLNEVERLSRYLRVKIGVRDFGLCYVVFIRAQGMRIRV